MKTERMVLLVTPAEKAKITTEAAKLRVSASEYVRKLVAMLDAEDLRAMEELVDFIPELDAMADRIEARQAEWAAQDEAREREWVYRRSPEYREKIRQEVVADETIDWDRVRALFGFARPEEHAA